MQNKKSIHWFRQDLRIKDNPSLDSASQFDSLLPIYILDDTNSEEFSMGAASRWWLYHSLRTLNESLDGKLLIYKEILTRFLSNSQRNTKYLIFLGTDVMNLGE